MNVLVLTTSSGQNFGRAVTTRLRRELAQHVTGDHSVYRYRVVSLDTAFQNHPEFNPSNTIIHCRAAHPTAQWMNSLTALESSGYRVVNNTASLRLTSDKLAYADTMTSADTWSYDGGHLVYTTTVRRNATHAEAVQIASRIPTERLVVKPRYSQGQGTHVHLMTKTEFLNDQTRQGILNQMPGCPIVVQEYIPYTAIYRVVVIDGNAMTAAITYDTPTDHNWKVSVCLNRSQRHFNPPNDQSHPDYQLALRLGAYAEQIQYEVSGEINFIDIYHTDDNRLVVSEVNTACNLSIHSRITGTDFASHIAGYLARVVADKLDTE